MISLDEYVRDNTFEEYQNILVGCVRRNLPLIMALQLEIEDVVQDLSLRMFRSIERFDGDRCRSLPLFLYHELQHEILNMRRRHKPHGIVGVPRDMRIDMIYLNQPREDGTFWDLPVYEDFDVTNRDAINALPEDERSVLVRKMNGEPIRKKADRELLANARLTLSDFFSERIHEYA